MKFNKQIVIFTLFFQSFFCMGMDPDLELVSQQLCMQQKLESDKKLPFPEPYRQQLVDYCNLKRGTKTVRETQQQIAIEKSEVKKEIEELQKTNQDLAKRNEALKIGLKKIEAEKKVLREKEESLKKSAELSQGLMRDCAALQNAFTNLQQTIQKKPVELPQKAKSPNADKQPTIAAPSKNTTQKKSRKQVPQLALMRKYRVRDRASLLEKLDTVTEKAFGDKSTKFDKKHHFFKDAVTLEHYLLFCPCTGELEIRDNHDNRFPENFGCDETCTNYGGKKISSPNRENDSTKSDSSDSSEEEPAYVIISKKEIDEMAD